MGFTSRKSRPTIPKVELTPMIDVVFLLIIFFMVVAQFAKQARLEMNLPREIGDRAGEEEAGLVINIDADGRIVLETDEPPVSIDELKGRVRAAMATSGADWQSLIIRADQDGTAKTLNEVLEMLHEQGLSATRIATQVP